MHPQFLSIVAFLTLLAVPIAIAQETGGPASNSGPEAVASDDMAEYLFALSEVVLERHVDPPTRQQMYLSGTKALFKAAGVRTTAEPSRRISALSSKEEFLAFTKDIWQTAAKSHDGSHDKLVAAMESGFLSPVPGGARLISHDDLRIQTQLQGNRYVGVGIALGYDKKLKLPQIFDRFVRGPAHKAGIERGDLIVEVDGRDTQGMPLQDVVQLLRGEEGTNVTMVVRQPDATETRRCEITRGVVPRETVVGYERLPDDDWNFRPESEMPIGYVRIQEITSSTLHELRRIERRLESEGIRAVVFDFRGNPGGRLHDHVSLANGLLDGGVIGQVRIGEKVDEFKADRNCLFRDWPAIALVDRHVAGGVEALVAALQDHGRAVVVGEPTAGAGYVKRAVPIPGSKRSVILATGVLERADGTPLVAPARPSGIPVRRASRPVSTDGARWRVKPEHIVVRSEPAGSEQKKTPATDAQLAKALELLQAELAQAEAS